MKKIDIAKIREATTLLERAAELLQEVDEAGDHEDNINYVWNEADSGAGILNDILDIEGTAKPKVIKLKKTKTK